MHEVAIIGGGPAGLSAALILGRCRRDVVLFDAGKPRNFASRGLHGFLTRDGVPPLHLRALGRADLARYPTVRLRDEEVLDARRRPEGHFELRLRDDERVNCRVLLLATGRVDLLPAKPGFREFYGRGVYHCPICDGWENRDRALAVHGAGPGAAEIALELLTWSRDIVLCTDGAATLDAAGRARLRRAGIILDEEPVRALRGGPAEGLEAIVFASGRERPCRALFFDAGAPQRSPIAEWLGCEIDATGAIPCDAHAATGIPGLFVAGNVRCGVHLAITAAAEGAEAAIAINDLLLEWDLR
jgi:thioredoxin reductase